MLLLAAPCLQEFPRLKHFPACMEPLMGTNCEEKQTFLQLPETLAELRTRLMDVGLSFINQLLLKGQYLAARGHWRLACILGVGLPYRAVFGVPGTCRELCLPLCTFPQVTQPPGSPCLSPEGRWAVRVSSAKPLHLPQALR